MRDDARGIELDDRALRQPWATMTVEFFQRLGCGEFGPASACATLLIVSVLVPLFFLQRYLGWDLIAAL